MESKIYHKIVVDIVVDRSTNVTDQHGDIYEIHSTQRELFLLFIYLSKGHCLIDLNDLNRSLLHGMGHFNFTGSCTMKVYIYK